MDNMFETGLAKRKETLGAEYVEKVFENADDFNRPFQEAMTAWCWDSAGAMRPLMPKPGR